MYDGARDHDGHLDYFDLMLRYRNVGGVVKCKILPLTLTKAALAWFQGLKPNLISSWSHLAELFSARFIASRSKPKSEKVLKAIHQGENETIREHVERFNEEVVNAKNLIDKMRLWYIEDDL